MSDVRDLLRRRVDASEYEAVRELWKQHSQAEERRDLPGLLATLTEDCVYEIVGTEHVWHGHEGRVALLHRAARRVPGHRLPADGHRDRPAGRLRGG